MQSKTAIRAYFTLALEHEDELECENIINKCYTLGLNGLAQALEIQLDVQFGTPEEYGLTLAYE